MKHYRVIKDYDGNYVPQSLFILSQEYKRIYIYGEGLREPYTRDGSIIFFENKELAISFLRTMKETEEEKLKRDEYNKNPEVVYESV